MFISASDFSFTNHHRGSPTPFGELGLGGYCHGGDACLQGMFSINLKGTPFQVAPSQQWRASAYAAVKLDRLVCFVMNSLLHSLIVVLGLYIWGHIKLYSAHLLRITHKITSVLPTEVLKSAATRMISTYSLFLEVAGFHDGNILWFISELILYWTFFVLTYYWNEICSPWNFPV